jgi:transcriptional regulator with XRE-family HTH domain
MIQVVQNIIALRKKMGFKQAIIANAIGCDVSNWSKVETGAQSLQIEDLEKIANCFHVRVIDLFTYPDRYVRESSSTDKKVSVTFEVSPEERDFLLSLVTKKE